VGGWIHLIDHYATNGEPASHYVTLINQKPYNYAEHYLPHDADAREWGNGLKRIDTLRALGLRNIRVLERIPVDDGINAARIILPTTKFDAVKCRSGLESLRQYRRDYDEDKRTFKPTPLHDWASHDADAFRYLAQGMKPEAAVPLDIPKYTPNRRKWKSGNGSWMTA
jgi:phage terminase large subunit